MVLFDADFKVSYVWSVSRQLDKENSLKVSLMIFRMYDNVKHVWFICLTVSSIVMMTMQKIHSLARRLFFKENNDFNINSESLNFIILNNKRFKHIFPSPDLLIWTAPTDTRFFRALCRTLSLSLYLRNGCTGLTGITRLLNALTALQVCHIVCMQKIKMTACYILTPPFSWITQF